MNIEIKNIPPLPENADISLLKESVISGRALMDDSKKTWTELEQQLIERSSRIIALRGAGSWNGMDKEEVDALLSEKLIPRIEAQLLSPGFVTILFDGDYDQPAKPDLGYVAGRLLEKFADKQNKVVFLVAQKESWHPKDLDGGNLANAQGIQYPTYLFPDKTYKGDHSSFTQSEELVRSDKYEQWYIGASGQIAGDQLQDYDSKVPEGEIRKAVLFRVKNNSALTPELLAKIEKAKNEGNLPQAENLEKRVQQRERQYGVHWNNDGSPDIDPSTLPHLEFEFVK